MTGVVPEGVREVRSAATLARLINNAILVEVEGQSVLTSPGRRDAAADRGKLNILSTSAIEKSIGLVSGESNEPISDQAVRELRIFGWPENLSSPEQLANFSANQFELTIPLTAKNHSDLHTKIQSPEPSDEVLKISFIRETKGQPFKITATAAGWNSGKLGPEGKYFQAQKVVDDVGADASGSIESKTLVPSDRKTSPELNTTSLVSSSEVLTGGLDRGHLDVPRGRQRLALGARVTVLVPAAEAGRVKIRLFAIYLDPKAIDFVNGRSSQAEGFEAGKVFMGARDIKNSSVSLNLVSQDILLSQIDMNGTEVPGVTVQLNGGGELKVPLASSFVKEHSEEKSHPNVGRFGHTPGAECRIAGEKPIKHVLVY